MCPLIPSARINAGELLVAEPALQLPEQGSWFVASKPNKHSSVLALQRVGLFLQSVVQLFFVHWMGVLNTHIDLVLFVQQKKTDFPSPKS